MPLITDYGTSYFYVRALEGSIRSANPEARTYIITHEMAAFGIAEGSYILAQAARVYPTGAVFAADVDPGAGADERSIVLLTEDGKLFVGPDNGLYTDVVNDLEIASFREIADYTFVSSLEWLEIDINMDGAAEAIGVSAGAEVQVGKI